MFIASSTFADAARLLRGMCYLRDAKVGGDTIVALIPVVEYGLNERRGDLLDYVLARPEIRWVTARGGMEWYANFLRGRVRERRPLPAHIQALL